MTMDVNNKKSDLKPDVLFAKADQHNSITTKTAKRSFDVAFLMLPDEKLKQKQKLTKFLNYDINVSSENSTACNNNDADDTEEDIEVGSPEQPMRSADVKSQNYAKYVTQKQQIFDDPNLSRQRSNMDAEIHGYRTKLSLNVSSDQKSAFTKVSLAPKECRMSPNLSVSPDLTYQNSLSPSPPIINRNYQNFPANMLSPNQVFRAQNTYQNAFIQENMNGFAAQGATMLDNPFMVKANGPELLQPTLSKIRPMLAQYRPDLAYNYPQFQTQEMLKLAQPDLKFATDIRHPAAAILTSLLPPSLAALSLPAQNVCAKCNITFRMTSDLVYHMRSHHKNDSLDYSKRKREDKLKCSVCAESFRERHHLTRHMTAHQDKDNDEEEIDVKKKNFTTFSK